MCVMDLNVPTKAKHVFGFEKETHDRNIESANSNVLNLEIFMDNDDDFNSVYGVETEDKETDERLEDT